MPMCYITATASEHSRKRPHCNALCGQLLRPAAHLQHTSGAHRPVHSPPEPPFYILPTASHILTSALYTRTKPSHP